MYDKAVTARQVLNNIIKKITDLNLFLAGIDQRYLMLLETDEKLQLARHLLSGISEIERVVELIRQEKDVKKEALKAISSKGG
jgi:uncharacterized linocin/CFP29 family protein